MGSIASDEEWDRAWEQSPSAPAYAGRAWAEVWADAFPGRFRPTPTRLSWPDGTTVIVPVTIEHRLGGALQIARLGPAGTYSAVLDGLPPTATADRRGPAIEWLLGRYRDVILTLDPFGPGAQIPVGVTLKGITMAVRLGDHVDDLRGTWSGGRKNDLARGRKAGLVVEGSTKATDWDAYYDCYVDSVRRWGDQTRVEYPKALFDALARAPDRLLRLWVARKDGAVVGGAIIVYDRSRAYYWHAASRQEGLQVGSATTVLYEAIRDATDRGLRYIDLGASGGMSGVSEFKAGFRPAELETTTLIPQSPISGLIRRLKHRM